MPFYIWNKHSEKTFLSASLVQFRLVNIQEVSNISYALKCKDITKLIAEEEWLPKQGLQSNKTQKTRDGYTGRAQKPQFWKRRQEQCWGCWLMESCLNCRVNYCTSALHPGKTPGSEISLLFYETLLNGSWANSNKTWTEFTKQDCIGWPAWNKLKAGNCL